MTIASLIIDVATNTAQLQTGVQKIHGMLEGITSVAGKMAGALGIGFSVGAVLNYANAAFDAAGQIVDLSAKTGLTTKTIQQMSFVAEQTGTSLEAFTNAAFKLGVNLAGDGKGGVSAAVERLGLSFQALQTMRPDQQFELIVAALQKMENPQERNRLAIELFGKAAAQILPAIAEGYLKIADLAVFAGDKQLLAIDKAADAWTRFKTNAQAAFQHTAGSAVLFYEQMGTGIETLTAKERAHYAFLMKSGGDHGAYLDELATKHIALRLEQEGVALQTKRQGDAFGALKALDIPKDIGLFELEYKKLERTLTTTIAKQEQMTRAQQQFAASVKNDFYTANYYVQFKTAVHEANFELEELASTLPSVATAFVPFKAAVQESSLAVDGWRHTVATTMQSLPSVIMAAIQGGGSAIGAAGAHIGVSLMSKFQEKFGPAIQAALPFGIGNAINALLPTLGALFGPIAEKIAGFFRSIFGGPSADELRGRQAVADFEAQLHSTLTATQRLEAGNVSWKMTVIALRDAYMAAGLTEAEALLAAERLWKSSQEGAAASALAIAEIEKVLKGASNAAAVLDSNLDAATQDRTINIGFNVQDFPEIPTGPGPGFASGSGGIRNFGSGTSVVLHGRERVQTEAQMIAEQRGGNSSSTERLERLIVDLPRAITVAFADALVLQGARR